MNNDHLLGTELLVDDFDQLSLNQLSKSSPSAFQVKRSRSSKQQRTILGRNNSNTNTNILINNINNNNGNSKPSNLSHVPCKFFKQGTCTAGANCVFSHSQDLASDSAVCKYFLKGNCKFGSKCALLHTLSPVDNTGRSKLLQHGTVAMGATSAATAAAARRKIQGSMSTTTMSSSSASQAIPIMSNTTTATNNNYLLVASPPDPRPYLNLTRDELNRNYGNSNNNSELSAAIRQNNIMLASASAPNADPSPLNNNFDKKYLLSPTTYTSSQNSLLNPQQQYHHRRTFSQQQSDEEDGTMIGRGGIGIVGRVGGNGHNTNNGEDVLLPSSLNDLLTPAELNRSRDRMLYHPSSSPYHNNNSRSPLGLSPFDMPPAPPPSIQSSSWHVPFLHRASSSFTTTPSIDEQQQQQDHLSLLSSSPSGSKAINIPGDHSHHRMTSASLLYRTGNGATTTTTTTGTGTSPSDEDDDPFSPFGNNMDELIFMQDENPEQVKSNNSNTTTSQSHHFQRMFSSQVSFPSLVHNSVPRS